MSEAAIAFKPKKSVALSGVPAGNTALCTVGNNDLHYRGYDILELAAHCEFEEVAYLLLYGKLPTRAELTKYKQHLRSRRGLVEIGMTTEAEASLADNAAVEATMLAMTISATQRPQFHPR